MKVHKDHLDKDEEFIGYCKVNFDIKTAKELLLLASSTDDQKMWVQRLSRKIAKKGYAQSNSDKSNSGYVFKENMKKGRRASYSVLVPKGTGKLRKSQSVDAPVSLEASFSGKKHFQVV